MITPQEKARELVDKFEDDLMECDTYFLEAAKKICALIAVEEILNEYWSHDTKRRDWWQQVKIEIQKLCK